MTEEEKQKAYIEALAKFNEEQGYALAPSPAWRYSNDGNDYRLIIQMQVVKLNKE